MKQIDFKSEKEIDDAVGKDTGHAYQTLNGRGYSFPLKSAATSHWVLSLPESSAPLADLGAGFGFCTAEAIENGRDVIAVDCEQGHLEKIEETVKSALAKLCSETEEHKSIQSGKLQALKLATLPEANLFENESISGVLLSHVLHFMSPGEPLQVFRDVYNWLQPGALFVVTTASPAALESLLNMGCELVHPRSMDELWQFLQGASDEEIVTECPTYVNIFKEPLQRRMGSRLICFSTNELRALAHLAGFEILTLKYEQPLNFAQAISQSDLTTLLVARKPVEVQQNGL